MSPPVAIVFDLDWTLYDADVFYAEAWQRVCARIGQETGRPAAALAQALHQVWEREGPSCPDLFNRWLRAVRLPEKPWLQTAMDVLHGDWTVPLRPYTGVPRMLHSFSEISLGLLTEGRSQTQRRKLDALGLMPWFATVLVTGELGTGKRTGEPYAEICQRLGVAPSRSLSVGDRVDSDIEPAASLGAATCLVGQGPFAARQRSQRADWQIGRIGELPVVVEAWLQRRA